MKLFISEQIPDWKDAFGLAHKAIRSLRTTTGVSSTLVGMRHPDYVDDLFKELRYSIKVGSNESWFTMTKFEKSYE